MMFSVLFKAFFIASLVKLLLETENPILCSALYASLAVGIGFMFGMQWVLVRGSISFALATPYFWLLNRFQGTDYFWLIFILGIAIGLVRGPRRRSSRALLRAALRTRRSAVSPRWGSRRGRSHGPTAPAVGLHGSPCGLTQAVPGRSRNWG